MTPINLIWFVGYWGSLYDESRRHRFCCTLDIAMQLILKLDDWKTTDTCEGHSAPRLWLMWTHGGYIEPDDIWGHSGVIGLQISWRGYCFASL